MMNTILDQAFKWDPAITGRALYFINQFGKLNPDKQPVFFSLNGSRLYGTSTEASDYDFVGACVEPINYFFAFKHFEQCELKIEAMQSEGVIYSLNKFVSMLASGNPTLLSLIFNDNAADRIGLTTTEIRNAIVSRRAADAFHGYARQQIKRIHTNQALHVTRQKLIQKYGYDTKYAAHVFRLVAQGVELLESGSISLPMHKDNIEECLFVLNGGYKTLDEFVREANTRLERLSAAEKESYLPEKADTEFLNDFLVTTYKKFSPGM